MASIRFQATGEKHEIDHWQFSPDYENEGWYITKCGKRCLIGLDIGKVAVQPPKTNCEECYGSRGN